MNPKIQEQIPISIYDLKKEVAKIKKRNKELSIRTNKTEDYINQYTVLKQSEADSLEKDLIKLNIPRLKEKHMKKLLDVLPASVEELKVIFSGYTLTVNKENQQKIASTIKKYIPEQK